MAVDEEQGLRGGQATGGRLLTARGRRTRTALVDSAKAVFGTIPFAEARIADITEHAHVATGTFYTYFDSKEEIFYEVAVEMLAGMSQAGHVDMSEVDVDPMAEIARSIRRYYRFCLRNVVAAQSIMQAANTVPSIARAQRNTVVAGVKNYERWIRELQIRRVCDTEIDSWDTAMVLHTMVVRVCYDHLLAPGHEDDVDRVADAVTHVWARTVGLERVPQIETAAPSAG